ncbi:hypothetical protein BKA62DRAFT_721356 [Auriculariales sp. MPI-PUGE-AT-0066]|nr:hypothetical protein BKA62DRAFT_721356 [Auriculariales sp. MPI-PUGE-AT-0066]
MSAQNAPSSSLKRLTITALPFELLAVVLTQVVRDAHWDLEHRNSPARRAVALDLSAVCASWRTLALAAPELWSFLNFNMDWFMRVASTNGTVRVVERDGLFAQFIGLALDRSKSYPLSLHIGGAHQIMGTCTIWEGRSTWEKMVLRMLPRILNLEIDCGISPYVHEGDSLSFEGSGSVLSCLTWDEPMPLLQFLSAVTLQAPSLRHILLDGFPPKMISPTAWPLLKTFHCNCRWFDLDMTLQEIATLAPDLEKLDICSTDWYGQGYPGMPRLRRLGGDATRMLKVVQRDTTPNIKALSLIDDKSFMSNVLVAFFQNTAYEDDACMFLDMLQFLPNVIRVDLAWNLESKPLLERWSQHRYIAQLPKLQHVRVVRVIGTVAGCAADLFAICRSRRLISGNSISSPTTWTLDWNLVGMDRREVEAAVKELLGIFEKVRLVHLCPMDRDRYDVAATYNQPVGMTCG